MFEQITAKNEVDRACINEIIQEGASYFISIFEQLNLPTLSQLARVLLQEVEERRTNEQRIKQQMAELTFQYQKDEADRCEYISTLQEECEALRNMINFLQAKHQESETRYNEMNSSSIEIISQMTKQMRQMKQSHVELQSIQKDCHAKQSEIKKMTIIINKLFQENETCKKFKVQNSMLSEQLEHMKNKYVEAKLIEEQLRTENQKFVKIVADLQQKMLDMEYIIKLKEKEIKSSGVQLNLLNTGKENASILKSLENNFQSNFMISSSKSSDKKSKGSIDFENSLDNVSENWDKLSLKEIEASSKHKPQLDTIFQGFSIKRRPFTKSSCGAISKQAKGKEVKTFMPIQDQQLLIPLTVSNKTQTLQNKMIREKEVMCWKSKLKEYTNIKQDRKESSFEKSLYAYTISSKKFVDSDSLRETYIFHKMNSNLKKQNENIGFVRPKEMQKNTRKKEELERRIIQLNGQLKDQKAEKKLLLHTKAELQNQIAKLREASIKQLNEVSYKLDQREKEKKQQDMAIRILQQTINELRRNNREKDRIITQLQMQLAGLKLQKLNRSQKQTNTEMISSGSVQSGTQDLVQHSNTREIQIQTIFSTNSVSCQSEMRAKIFIIQAQVEIRVEGVPNMHKPEEEEKEKISGLHIRQYYGQNKGFNTQIQTQGQANTLYYSFEEEGKTIEFEPMNTEKEKAIEVDEIDNKKIVDMANEIMKSTEANKSYSIQFQRPFEYSQITISDILERVRNKKKQYYILKTMFREKGKILKDHLFFWKQGVISIRRKQFLLNIDKKIVYRPFNLLLGNSQIILSQSWSTIQIKRSSNSFLLGNLQDHRWSILDILAHGSYSS